MMRNSFHAPAASPAFPGLVWSGGPDDGWIGAMASAVRSPRDPEPGPVLIVDDDPDVRALLQQALEDAGLVVETAGSADEAVAKLRAARPALVILDLWLGTPEGSGTVARVSPEGVPVLMISGRQELAEPAPSADAPRGFLPKPFDLDQLYASVFALLAQNPDSAMLRVWRQLLEGAAG